MSDYSIQSMFGGEGDKTWVFAGGRTVSGSAAAIGHARCFSAHFEEYIRFSAALPFGDKERQRYVINAGMDGAGLAEVESTFSQRIAPLSPACVAYLAGEEDLNGFTDVSAFSYHLMGLLEQILSLRENTGIAVIQTPFSVSSSEKNHAASLLTLSIFKLYSSLPAEKRERITIIDHYTMTDTPDFRNTCLNPDDSLNKKGHLLLARQLAEETIKNVSGHPFDHTFSQGPAPLLWKFEPSSKEPSPASQKLEQLMADKSRHLTFLFIGDSIYHGAAFTCLHDSITQYFKKYLTEDQRRPGDLVINTAVSGATTKLTLDYRDQRILCYPADIALIMLGTNDASNNKIPEEGGNGQGLSAEIYRRNLDALIEAVISCNPETLILLSTPLPTTDPGRIGIMDNARAVREAARTSPYRQQILLIDQYAFFTDLIRQTPKIQDFFPDGIHPNEMGHLLMMQILLQESGLWIPDGYIASLPYSIQ